MRERDSALENAIGEVAAILGDALVRLIVPELFLSPVDFAETESPDGTAR